MKNFNKRRIVLIIVFILLILISLKIGVIEFNYLDLFKGDNKTISLLFISRLPRTLAIILSASSLSIAGLIMQSIGHNNFISPSTIGTSDAALFGILTAYILFGSQSLSFKLSFAFIFAFVSTLVLIQILNRLKLKEPIYVPLVGMMYGSIISSFSTFIAHQFDASQVLSSISLGTFTTMTKGRYELLWIIIIPLILSFIYATQTFVLFIFGANSILLSHPVVNFALTSTIMILVSLILYGYLLKKYSRQIAFLLLFGLVISTLLRSSSSFIQILLNPDEFQSLVALTTVSISNIDANLILWIIPFMIILIILFYRKSSQYDVMALGRDSALSLGLDYDRTQRTTLITLSAAMAISTALVGPMTFLGLIAVNSARELLKTYKHTQLFVTSSLLSIVMLVLGQLIIEQIGFITSVTVLLNLVGGIYLIYLILKEGQL